MKRILFSEISPLTYRISMEKEILKRRLKDLCAGTRFAEERVGESLPVVVYRHKSLIRRRLGNVNMQLQENKAVNLALAVKQIDGLVIHPGETFSVWKLLGRTSKRKGYREGLTITEHHHHDALDLFPDFGRQIPFGTGTSISYNYIDYRIKNETENTYQLRLKVDGEYLRGELRARSMQSHTFHIHAKNEFFSRENGIVYRNGEVYRDTIDRQTGAIIERS